MTRPGRKPGRAVVHSDTRTYSEEPLLGRCEAGDCDGRARVSCPTCKGDFCRAHADHSDHSQHASSS